MLTSGVIGDMNKSFREPVCPICGVPLRPVQSRGVDFYVCGAGHGAWVPADAVRRLAGGRAVDWPAVAGPGPFGIPRITGSRISPVKSGTTMVERRYRGSRLDVCPASGGVWLDHDEIVQILDVNAAELPPKAREDWSYGWHDALALDALEPVVWAFEILLGAVTDY